MSSPLLHDGGSGLILKDDSDLKYSCADLEAVYCYFLMVDIVTGFSSPLSSYADLI